MTKVDAAVAGAFSIAAVLVIMLGNPPSGVETTATVVGFEDAEVSVEVNPAGDNRLLIAVIVRSDPIAEISSVDLAGNSLSPIAKVSLGGDEIVEILGILAPEATAATLTATMSTAVDGELAPIYLTKVSQAGLPTAIWSAVGQDVPSISVPEISGDATLCLVIAKPATSSIGTPSGFTKIKEEIGYTDTRIGVFLDDDNYSGSVDIPVDGHSIVVMIGLDNV